MSDLIAKGGRGNKAPYETTLVRVPLTVKPLVEKLTAAYRRCFEVSSDDLSIALGEMLERVEVAIGQSAVPGAERLCQEKAIAPPEKPVNKIDYEATRDSQRLLATRDRYLVSLRLGKQAPEYKRAKQHIDAFIKELEKAEARS